jgi:hypothetical protein
VTFGTAGLAALAQPIASGGKKKKKKKCQNQVPQCEAEVIAICEGDQGCLDSQLPCCPLGGDCNLTAFFGCLV